MSQKNVGYLGGVSDSPGNTIYFYPQKLTLALLCSYVSFVQNNRLAGFCPKCKPQFSSEIGLIQIQRLEQDHHQFYHAKTSRVWAAG